MNAPQQVFNTLNKVCKVLAYTKVKERYIHTYIILRKKNKPFLYGDGAPPFCVL